MFSAPLSTSCDVFLQFSRVPRHARSEFQGVEKVGNEPDPHLFGGVIDLGFNQLGGLGADICAR